MPLPTSTIPTTTFPDTDAKPSGTLRMYSWEEPHPGRRLSYPNDTPTTWGSHTGGEGRRGGVAAEGRWPDHATDFSFAASATKERKGRGRTRTAPQQLVLANAGHARPEIQTAPLPRCNMPLHRADGSLRKDNARRAREAASEDDSTIHALGSDLSGTDSDTDSSISAPPRKRMALQPLDTSFHRFHFTDVSRNLGISMDIDESEHNAFSAACSDVAAFSVMSPDDDLYGWNAVLERKTTQPNCDTSTTNHQRRASRSKRSLLQRVFSPGGHETPSNPPTSFADMEFFESERR